MLKIVNIIINIATLIFCMAAIYAILGGGTLHPLPGVQVSIHNPFRSVAFLVALLVLKFIVSAPRQYTFSEKIDYCLTKVIGSFSRITIRGDTVSPAGKCLGYIGFPIKIQDIHWRPERLLLSLMSAWTLLLFFYPTYKYFAFGDITDLNVFVVAMDDAVQGHLFYNVFHYLEFHSFNEYLAAQGSTEASMFSIHFRPVLFLLVPFYAVFSSPLTLFFFVSLLLGSSIWPAYQISKHLLKSEKYAFALTFCYCFNPMVIAAAKAFLPGVLSIAFLLWGVWFSINNRYVLVLLMLVLTLTCKEIMALPVISFGAYLFFFRKKYVLGGCVVSGAVAYLLICLNFVMPSFIPEGTGYIPVGSMYSRFGSSLPEIVMSLVVSPWKMGPFIFSFATLKYFFKLLWPLAFVPLVGWRVFLLNTPVLLQNLLIGEPGDSWQRDILGHWSAPLVPFTFLAAVTGIKRLKNKVPAETVRNTILVMVTLSLISSLYSIPRLSNYPLKKSIDVFKQTSQAGSSVSTNIIPAWASLRRDYDLAVFPKNAGTSDYVIVSTSVELVERLNLGNRVLSYAQLPRINIEKQKQADKYSFYAALYCRQLQNDPELDKIFEIPEDEGKRVISIFARKERGVK